MRIAMFYHSLLSDWNHGNAHFLRGVVTELMRRGHEVRVYEPENGWSLRHLLAEHGEAGLESFRAAYPGLESTRYTPENLDLDAALDGTDLVVAHEWNEPWLIERLADQRRRRPSMRLLFHDTHHRAASRPREMARYALRGFDGALVFGEVLREIYRRRGWTRRAWTWHEAADVRIFRPRPAPAEMDELVWIGNWGDGERAAELREFLLEPVRRLGLRATVYGVRYPAAALAMLKGAGIRYGGWLPNALAPEAFARARATVHVPRRPYVAALPGIPTIRVFEALACRIPLVCSPWRDTEGLFTPGQNYLTAHCGDEMAERLRFLLDHPGPARAQAERGMATIRRRHTCAHRVDELMEVCRELGLGAREVEGFGRNEDEGRDGADRVGIRGGIHA